MVTSDEARRRAAARGVATSYQDWQGQQVEVPQATLEAILAALGDEPAGPGPGQPAGQHGPGPVAPVPGSRSWGFSVQLYSLRSRQSWGHGDLRDLADLAVWSASDLGAGFVLINPLHAAEPLPPLSPSPYLPMSRRFTSPLYLRIEDIPEYAGLSAGERRAHRGARRPAARTQRHQRAASTGTRSGGPSGRPGDHLHVGR